MCIIIALLYDFTFTVVFNFIIVVEYLFNVIFCPRILFDRFFNSLTYTVAHAYARLSYFFTGFFYEKNQRSK